MNPFLKDNSYFKDLDKPLKEVFKKRLENRFREIIANSPIALLIAIISFIIGTSFTCCLIGLTLLNFTSLNPIFVIIAGISFLIMVISWVIIGES